MLDVKLKIAAFTAVLLFSLNSFGIMERDGYPWNVKLNLNNEYESELNSKYPNGGWFLNLGPTGIRAQITPDKPKQFQVKFVFQDKLSPAKGKIKIGDVIIGANGKEFKSAHIFGRRGNRKGWGGPILELSKHIEDSQGKDGKLTLMVLEGGKNKKTVELQLKAVGRFTANYPFDCERSEMMAKQLCDNLAEHYKKTGKFGRIHAHTHAVLALMANGYKDHESMVKKILSGYASKRYDSLAGGFATWGWGFDGIVMGEATHLYKDKKYKAAMESVAAVYKEGSKGTGIFTHRSYRTLDKMGKSPYAAIAGISGLSMLSLSMIKRAGYEYDEDFYNVIHQHYLNSSSPECLGIAYAFGNNAPNKNRPGIEPRHAIIRLKDPKKGLSGKGPGFECPTGMQNIGEYEIIWPTKADPRYKDTSWIEKEAKSNKLFEVYINKGSITGEGLRKVERHHPDYKEPRNPEPKKAYRTSKGAMHCLPIGLGALAHLIDPEGRPSWKYLGKHAANTTALSYEHAFDGHGGGNLHGFWTILGAAQGDEDKKREFLDYMKCFLIMSETHYGQMIIQPWSRDRIGGNGDPHYGPTILPTAAAAILLSLRKKRLLITGALDGQPPMAFKPSKSTSKSPSGLKPISRPTAKILRVKDGKTIKLDRMMTYKANNVLKATLRNMSAKKEIAPVPFKISTAKVNVILLKVEDDTLTFRTAASSKNTTTYKFSQFRTADFANLSQLVAFSLPENKIAQALASIYMENFSTKEHAGRYLKRSTPEDLAKLEQMIIK